MSRVALPLAATLLGAIALCAAERLQPVEAHFVTPDGVRLFYRAVGEGGNRVILLHGGPAGDMTDAAGRLDGLAAAGQLVFYDQRGGGRSEVVTDPAPGVIPREAERRCGMPPAAIRNVSRVQNATLGSLGDWDFRPTLKALTMPALVIEGELSTVPLDSTRAWAQALPAGRLLLVPDAGHAHFVEKPRALIAAGGEFLRGRGPHGSD